MVDSWSSGWYDGSAAPWGGDRSLVFLTLLHASEQVSFLRCYVAPIYTGHRRQVDRRVFSYSMMEYASFLSGGDVSQRYLYSAKPVGTLGLPESMSPTILVSRKMIP